MKEKIKIQKGFIPISLLAILIAGVFLSYGVGYGFNINKEINKALKEVEQLVTSEKYDEANNILDEVEDNWLIKNLNFKKGQINEIKLTIEKNKYKALEGKLTVAEIEINKGIEAVGEAEQRATSEQLAKEQQQRETEFQKERAGQEEKTRVLELAKTHPLIKAIVSGELKFYIDPLPSYAATGVSSEVEALAGNFSSLNFYGASVKRVYNSNDADLTVFWIRDYGSDTIGESIYRAHIKVGLGFNNCVGIWSAFDASTVKKILWHELGHSMGYGHSSNQNNVMYYPTDTRFEIDHEISEVIAGSYFFTIPLCKASTYSYSFETNDINTGFDLFVIPADVDAKNFSGESGNTYVGCGKKGMHRYSGSCTVKSGSKIYIGNTSYQNAIQLSGKIIDMNNPQWPDMTWDQNVFQYDQNQLTKYWGLFH